MFGGLLVVWRRKKSRVFSTIEQKSVQDRPRARGGTRLKTTFSAPSTRTRPGLHHPAPICLGCASVCRAMKETKDSCHVGGYLCPLPHFHPLQHRPRIENCRTKLANLRLRPSSVQSPLAPPRTPSLGVYGWV